MERENLFLDELNCSFFNPNWEDCSTDQNDPFESALSSMVSSPTASTANANHHFNGENIVLRELIGRLGSICNSGEVSPQQLQAYSINGNHSTNTSCYSTPLNSPTKIKLSMMENQRIRGNLQMKGSNLSSPPSIAPFSTDPGFAERAARFSCFANKTLVGFNELSPNLDSGKISRVSSSQSIKIYGSSSIPRQEQKDEEKSITGLWPENAEIVESMENSSLSEQIIGLEIGSNSQIDANSRKRKAAQKAKGKEAPVPESSETSGKRSKIEDSSANEKDAAKTKGDANQKKSDDDSKPPEPPKDYIHVRARRGQATDAHSLAERVRREKISERMKFLQDLVPGCNKVTGKAVMLDEIINYVQSLQRQVEFLSMKLATINPRMESNMETLLPKDMYQSRGSVVPCNIYPSYGYTFHSQPNFHNTIPIPTGTEACLTSQALGATLGRNHCTQLPSMENYTKTAPQVWEGDLQSFVQMGFGENQAKTFSGILPTTQMKVEQ